MCEDARFYTQLWSAVLKHILEWPPHRIDDFITGRRNLLKSEWHTHDHPFQEVSPYLVTKEFDAGHSNVEVAVHCRRIDEALRRHINEIAGDSANWAVIRQEVEEILHKAGYKLSDCLRNNDIYWDPWS